MNRKRVLRVMRERSLLVRSRRLRARRKKEWGRVEATQPNQIWQSDMTKIWAGPAVGWTYLVCVIDCCTGEIVGWNLSHRCRTEGGTGRGGAGGVAALAGRKPPLWEIGKKVVHLIGHERFASYIFIEDRGCLEIRKQVFVKEAESLAKTARTATRE